MASGVKLSIDIALVLKNVAFGIAWHGVLYSTRGIWHSGVVWALYGIGDCREYPRVCCS